MEENNLNAIQPDTAAEASSAPEADVSASPSRRGGDADENTAAEPSARTRREEFERLISGEYKDVFTERVAGIIGRRFAVSRREAEERERASRLREDGEGALAAGFAARSGRAADEAESIYAAWVSDAAALAKDYPGFDLAAVAKEPAFARLLRGGADLRSAYEATHMETVRSAIRAAAAAEAEARALDSVRLRGLRPGENGARSGAAVTSGGMAGLSRAERARIAERAMRGLL